MGLRFIIEFHQGVFALLIFEIVVVVSLFYYHVLWSRRQQKRETWTNIRKEVEAYSLHIARHFLPSVRLERYRFRGLKKQQVELSIAFDELGLELPDGSRVLEGVSGEFVAGRMCAIMGPSGAGKTTFMNALCGKATYGRTTGRICINGEESDVGNFKSIIGFVPQDDTVYENLTVREQIRFSAELRNSMNTSSTVKYFITEDVLNVMQVDHIQNKIVGGVEARGISGGQRKRVNIGLELAANPSVLFLDEPTSGLDATSSLAIVHSLKQMAQLGMTSIMVIHQPRYSLFTLFDDVLLLGKGGKTVYLGPSLHAKEYFEERGFVMEANENPADWFMDVLCGEKPNLKINDFQPSMLFDWWEDNKHSVEISFGHQLSRCWTPHDDRSVLIRSLEEEWSQINTNSKGVMDENELQELLTLCKGTKPDMEVVRELMDRMAGRDAEAISKENFLNYFAGLQSVVASDRTSSFESANSDDEDAEGDHDLELCPCRCIPFHIGGQTKDVRETNRKLPGFFRQLRILCIQRIVHWWRNNRHRGIFLAVVAVAAVLLAVMDGVVCQDPLWAPDPYLNLHTCLALLTSVYCLGVFSGDRPLFWRESARGVNVLAFYLARVLTNTFDLLLQCYLFAALYYLLRQPNFMFLEYFVPFLLVSFASSGIGYVISTFLRPQHGPFVAALVSFVSCGLLGHPQKISSLEDGGLLEAIMNCLSITRWSVGMTFLKYADANDLSLSNPDPESQQAIQTYEEIYRTKPMWQGYGYWNTGIMFLSGMGFVLYVLGYVGLKVTNRDKQV